MRTLLIVSWSASSLRTINIGAMQLFQSKQGIELLFSTSSSLSPSSSRALLSLCRPPALAAAAVLRPLHQAAAALSLAHTSLSWPLGKDPDTWYPGDQINHLGNATMTPNNQTGSTGNPSLAREL